MTRRRKRVVKTPGSSTLNREERFWLKVSVKGEYECWPWTAKLPIKKGNWKFWDGSRPVPPRRWIYEHKIGPIPTGMDVRHATDRVTLSWCVNPAHLYLTEALYESPEAVPIDPVEGGCTTCGRPLDPDQEYPTCIQCRHAESVRRYKERHAND